MKEISLSEEAKLKKKLNKAVDSMNSALNSIQEIYPDANYMFSDGCFSVILEKHEGGENYSQGGVFITSKRLINSDSGDWN